MRQSRAFFQVIEELLFYGFHAVMRSPVYALCNTHRLLDTGADLLVDRNVFLRFQSHLIADLHQGVDSFQRRAKDEEESVLLGIARGLLGEQ